MGNFKDKMALVLEASEKQDLLKIISKQEIMKIIKAKDLNDKQFAKIFDYYMSGAGSGEMPMGTMKARTGDPYEWIVDRLSSIFGKKY